MFHRLIGFKENIYEENLNENKILREITYSKNV